MITDLPTKYHYFVTGGTKSQSSVIYFLSFITEPCLEFLSTYDVFYFMPKY